MDASKEKLLEIKAMLIASRSEDLVQTLESLGVQQFLDVINTCQPTDKEYFNEVIQVLRLVLDSLPPNYVLTRLKDQLKGALRSRHDELKGVWLRSLNNCLSNPEDFQNLINSDDASDILEKLVEIVGEDDETNYRYASDIIKKCASLTRFQQILFSSDLESKWVKIKSRNVVLMMRVLEFMTNLACISETLAELVEKSGSFDELFQCLQTDDVLAQLNALQILFSVASTHLGAQYLHERGYLESLKQRFLNFDSHGLMAEQILASFISIFGSFGKLSPSSMISHYGEVIQRILSYCREGSQNGLVTASVAVFANIATTLEGKKALNKVKDFAPICMKCIRLLIDSSHREKRAEALTYLQLLLQIDDQEASTEVETLTASWFEHLDTDKKMISLLIQFSQRPFPEIRLPALNVLRILCSYQWGQKILSSNTNFLKVILDRSKGIDKNGKEAKYAIVKELNLSPFTPSYFDQEDVEKIRQYYREGPFFVQIESMVALESQ